MQIEISFCYQVSRWLLSDWMGCMVNTAYQRQEKQKQQGASWQMYLWIDLESSSFRHINKNMITVDFILVKHHKSHSLLTTNHYYCPCIGSVTGLIREQLGQKIQMDVWWYCMRIKKAYRNSISRKTSEALLQWRCH